MIYLTQAAAQEIKRLQESRQKLDTYFRLGVKAGGCSGLYYTLDFSADSQGNDSHYESQGIKIIVDPNSYFFLEDLQIDYAEDLMGGGFRFTNPHSTSSCSCGLSFTKTT